MAERTHIPSSPACGQWETLLADALDGLLKPEDEATFTAHMAVCAACTALFEEARRGREWLEFLSPEPEVPEGLLDRILAQTGPGQVAGYGLVPGSSNVMPIPQPWQRPGFMGQIRRFAEPRLLMTAAMAFFSIALTLNLTNVKLSSLRLSDLRPTAVRSFVERRVTMASTPIIRYYDHLRFVYEVESRMRELRRTTESSGEDSNQQKPKDAAPGESKQNPGRKDGGSRVDPPQQSVSPTITDATDLLESSLTFPVLPSNSFKGQEGPALSGGSEMEVRERSATWTA
ncbi:MAG: anti-sigma factor family protein [Terracidiphilus sp.]